VVLSDYENKVLLNLQACATANVASAAPTSTAVAREYDGGARPHDLGCKAQPKASNRAPVKDPDAEQPHWDMVRLQSPFLSCLFPLFAAEISAQSFRGT